VEVAQSIRILYGGRGEAPVQEARNHRAVHIAMNGEIPAVKGRGLGRHDRCVNFLDHFEVNRRRDNLYFRLLGQQLHRAVDNGAYIRCRFGEEESLDKPKP
jgi:hypothetical protein